MEKCYHLDRAIAFAITQNVEALNEVGRTQGRCFLRCITSTVQSGRATGWRNGKQRGGRRGNAENRRTGERGQGREKIAGCELRNADWEKINILTATSKKRSNFSKKNLS